MEVAPIFGEGISCNKGLRKGLLSACISTQAQLRQAPQNVAAGSLTSARRTSCTLTGACAFFLKWHCDAML